MLNKMGTEIWSPPPPPLGDSICPECAGHFDRQATTQIFCGKRCRRRAINRRCREKIPNEPGSGRPGIGKPMATLTEQVQPSLFFGLCRCLERPVERAGLCRCCYARQYRSRRFFGGHRDAVLRRDHRRCRACGVDRRIVVHHRQPSVHDRARMITLCARCHARIHHSFVLRCWVTALTVELWRELHPDSPMQLQLALLAENGTSGLAAAA